MPKSKRRLIFLSSLSGAGRKTALSIFDDMGFYTVDNLPFSMLYNYLDTIPNDDIPVIISFGMRFIDFDAQELKSVMHQLNHNYEVHFCFLKANNNTIQKRYSLTGMTHPLCKDGNLEKAIQSELDIFQSFIDDISLLIETDNLGPKDLREHLIEAYGNTKKTALVISSFGFKYGVPKEAEIIFDARILKNPHWQPDIASFTGQDKVVQEFLKTDPNLKIFLSAMKDYIDKAILPFLTARKSFYHIAIGCTGGKHRSVYSALKLYNLLQEKNIDCRLQHKTLEGFNIIK